MTKLNISNETFIIYLCPICGRTIKHPTLAIYTPNLDCVHIDENKIEFHQQMIKIWPIDNINNI
jgi:hypothetical protein